MNVFDPELVVIGGGFGEAGELLLGPARERAVAERAARRPRRGAHREAQLGPEAGVIGAGSLRASTRG